tara:strand:- start:3052 stop:3675 length:624 start_codon:yes stop_codon:yes gene_type:complete
MKRGKFKFLKLLNEYRSINYELKYVRDVLEDVHLEFEDFYRTWCAENNVDLEELNQRNQRKVDMIFMENKAHKIKQELMLSSFKEERVEAAPSLKQVYKSIARKLHPDLLDTEDPRLEEYEEGFKKASRAHEEGKWGELFDLVDKHNIKLKEYKEAIECLKFDIKRVKSDLEKEKSTYSWLYYEAESDEQRIGVVKRFLKHLFGWNG